METKDKKKFTLILWYIVVFCVHIKEDFINFNNFYASLCFDLQYSEYNDFLDCGFHTISAI